MNVELVGRYLAETRKLYKLTQEDLAKLLCVSRQAISKWETGSTLPEIEILMRLSKLYNVTINDILDADLSKISKSLAPKSIDTKENSKNIGVIGCGRWGTFTAWYLDKIGHHVMLYGRKESARMSKLIAIRKNEYVSINETIVLTNDLEDVIQNEIILIAINSQNLSDLAEKLASYSIKQKKIVLCMKGLDITSGRRLSQIMDDTLDRSNRVSVWIGPGHVEEYYKGIPNCMVIDGTNEMVKKELIQCFSSELIRFYYGIDLVGNEIGASTKNVIGIAAGMLDALGISSLKGPLMSRGTREIARLIKAMGGNELSAYGLCHLGDYEATLFSEHSHNRKFGESFIRKEPYNSLAEGYYTVKAVVSLAKNYGMELPICSTVYEILYENANPRESLEALFRREIKEEF